MNMCYNHCAIIIIKAGFIITIELLLENMYNISVTDAENPDFAELIRALDDEYYALYGDVILMYRQQNKTDNLLCAVLVYCDAKPVACGGIRFFNDETVEIKRIFVQEEHRRRGIAKMLICRLEEEAAKRGFKRAILETGNIMKAAQSLYVKLGYRYTENYGAFAGDANCVCMEKMLD